jgi:pimeloyl-ACP methyl ester carboxylesterase
VADSRFAAPLWLPRLLALAGGLGLSFAFAPFGQWWLAVAAPALLLVLWGRSPGPREAYVAGMEASVQGAARLELERTQRPQGIAVLREKWRGDLDITRRPGYILTTADTLVPPESQRAMAASIGARVSEIHTDHGPFREQPERLAELLIARAGILIGGAERFRSVTRSIPRADWPSASSTRTCRSTVAAGVLQQP